MSEFYTHTAGEDGWSEWVQPQHDSYLMKCCDCGLVHEFEFRVVRDGDDSAFVDLEDVIPGKVLFRARREAMSDQQTMGRGCEQHGYTEWVVSGRCAACTSAEVDARIAELEREIAELKRVPDGGAMDRAVAAEARLAKCEMARLGCDAPCNPQEDE